jgi:hypothetical protein
VKPFSERHDGGTPAVRVGTAERPYTVKELLKSRVFPRHVVLPEEYRRYHDGGVITPRIQHERRFEAKLAC